MIPVWQLSPGFGTQSVVLREYLLNELLLVWQREQSTANQEALGLVPVLQLLSWGLGLISPTLWPLLGIRGSDEIISK